ncbi:MAG: IS66 family insertion sequence element accessory protein TnpB [Saprospiraceae bacterium]|nr:IS66 family insertion sequence element accessory protein TnpB [Candidatus Vicinibacter affinis]
MIPFTSGHRYFVYSGIVDFRKGYNGLSGVVKSNMESNPFQWRHLYIFQQEK